MRVVFQFINNDHYGEECQDKFLEGVDFEVDFPTFLSEGQSLYAKAIHNEDFQKMCDFLVDNYEEKTTFLETIALIKVDCATFDSDEKGIYQRCFVFNEY